VQQQAQPQAQPSLRQQAALKRLGIASVEWSLLQPLWMLELSAVCPVLPGPHPNLLVLPVLVLVLEEPLLSRKASGMAKPLGPPHSSGGKAVLVEL